MTCLAVHCGFQYEGGFQLRADFEIGPGITTLAGPSGQGKSTTVALIAGLLAPTLGEIRFGRTTWSSGEQGLLVPPERRRIGVAFQDGRLFPHLSVRRNLLYGRRRFAAAHPSLEEVLGVLEIGELLARRPGSLSGGQRQRVALGRALLASEELILLDEPVSAIEGPLRGRILDYLASGRQSDRILLVVTHDSEAIRHLNPDHTLTAEQGRITPPEPPANGPACRPSGT